MNIFKTHILLLLSVLFILFFSKTVLALNEDTHEAINKRVAEITLPNDEFSLNDYLINQLGIENGIKEEFNSKEIVQWLQLGGRYEDSPLGYIPLIGPLIGYTVRSKNHFHDPITDMGYHGLFFGMSSIEWALLDKQTQELGYYSWHDVRDYYHKALTSSEQNTRNTNFAKTFRGIGQLMHHVQDASSPPHTRNDQHPEYNYETWVKDNKSTDGDISGYTPKFFTGTRNSMKSFIDTDQYNIASDPDDITDSTTIGIAEYTNANFFSNDTNAIESTSFTYPQITEDTDIVEKEFVNKRVPVKDTNQRKYYKKNYDGEKYGVDGTGYLLSGVDYFEYYRKSLNPIGGAKKLIAPLLDHNVYSDYADLLLPRAIGYSAGLLNYFFRGEIDIIRVNSSNIKIKNNSSEDMDGVFTLYYDAVDGNRKPVSNGLWYRVLQSGSTSNELSFTEPTDFTECKEYILVFQGTLGSETGAVVGKVVEKCLNFIGDPLSGPASLDVTFSPDDITYYHAWDYGDGAEGFVDRTRPSNPLGEPVSHRYYAPGLYTVTASFSLTGPLWTTIPYQNLITWSKGSAPYSSTEAQAWANWVSRPWVQSYNSVIAYHGLNNGSPTEWVYVSRKFTLDVDLTAYDGSKPIYVMVAFDTNNLNGYGEPMGAASGGWKSSLGGSVDRANKYGWRLSGRIPRDVAYYRLLDLTPYAGTNVTGIEFTDNTDYARKTGPFDQGNRVFYGFRSVYRDHFLIVEIQTPICTTTRENYITVTE